MTMPASDAPVHKGKAQKSSDNRGARIRQVVPVPDFPNTDDLLREEMNKRPAGSVDLLLVNPPDRKSVV